MRSSPLLVGASSKTRMVRLGMKVILLLFRRARMHVHTHKLALACTRTPFCIRISPLLLRFLPLPSSFPSSLPLSLPFAAYRETARSWCLVFPLRDMDCMYGRIYRRVWVTICVQALVMLMDVDRQPLHPSLPKAQTHTHTHTQMKQVRKKMKWLCLQNSLP